MNRKQILIETINGFSKELSCCHCGKHGFISQSTIKNALKTLDCIYYRLSSCFMDGTHWTQQVIDQERKDVLIGVYVDFLLKKQTSLEKNFINTYMIS